MSNRTCEHCNRLIIEGEPDPCLKGYIPGVKYACCGHGTMKANVMFENRVNISGIIAYLFLLAYKRGLEVEEKHYHETLENIEKLKKRIKGGEPR